MSAKDLETMTEEEVASFFQREIAGDAEAPTLEGRGHIPVDLKMIKGALKGVVDAGMTCENGHPKTNPLNREVFITSRLAINAAREWIRERWPEIEDCNDCEWGEDD